MSQVKERPGQHHLIPDEVTVPAAGLPEHVGVRRSDPVYMAHGYLTKVPPTAIEPFIEALCPPDGVVLDVFAGSGMTGVAAVCTGRRAELRDIAVLGRHVGSGYLNIVPSDAMRRAADAALAACLENAGDLYAAECASCGEPAELVRRTVSAQYACPSCGEPVTFYDALEAADWHKSKICCPACDAPFKARGAAKLDEVPVLDTVRCACSPRQLDQPPGSPLYEPVGEADPWPDVEIGADRQMYKASALGKHGLTTTARFFSDRNLRVLAALRAGIAAEPDEALRAKLMFCFTAILPRASKRYQWSAKRPLNAANQTYYIAPVFYEWNVLDLFGRKVDAARASDDAIRARLALFPPEQQSVRATYKLGSADALDLPDASIDYVFCDPPFGSNIFYSDMNLFQEAWLGEFTDASSEAVVDRTRGTTRTAERYEALLAAALKECKRVLRPEGYLSLVFSNSSGRVWALLERAVAAAGFALRPDGVAVLDKGQRSVKGLSSGFEHVVTSDLVLTMRSVDVAHNEDRLRAPGAADLETAVDAALADERWPTPSHVYLAVVKDFWQRQLDLDGLDISAVVELVAERGWTIDDSTGRLRRKVGCQHANENGAAAH
jgi:16S rRNA G966 N2-methylase RsmD